MDSFLLRSHFFVSYHNSPLFLFQAVKKFRTFYTLGCRLSSTSNNFSVWNATFLSHPCELKIDLKICRCLRYSTLKTPWLLYVLQVRVLHVRTLVLIRRDGSPGEAACVHHSSLGQGPGPDSGSEAHTFLHQLQFDTPRSLLSSEKISNASSSKKTATIST